jgi:lipopolysaccharide transport system ATP-binding protein
MIDSEREIGICGTFDLENYGDLLFPIVAEKELNQRLGPLRMHRFSYASKAPPAWPYTVEALTDLPALAVHLDGLIVGGGHLIRFDKAIAPGYGPLSPAIHHPTGYWLTPMLIALQNGCPVVWNAPGTYGEIPDWAEPLMELVLRQSSYLSVRDDTSRQALQRFAGQREIAVVPDSVFGIARLMPAENPSTEYLALRDSLGLKGDYLIVQANADLEAFTRLLQNHPLLGRAYPIVILPVGPVHGDAAPRSDENIPNSIRLPAWPSPLLIAELIGHAAAVVGTSMHLAITAISYGVPVFRPATAFAGKYSILSDFASVMPFDAATGMDPDWFASHIGRTAPPSGLTAIHHQLSAHWDCIADCIAAPDSSASALESLGHFWESMPNVLEAWAVRYSQALAERDAANAKLIRLKRRGQRKPYRN